MVEILHPIEPNVTPRYLLSAESVLNQIRGIHKSGYQKTIKPTALENTDYFLSFYTYTDSGLSFILVRVVNKDGSDINNIKTGCDLNYNPYDQRGPTVCGSYFNYSDKIDKVPQGIVQDPIRNISGVIAPYEDAICMSFAKLKQNRETGVTRKVDTSRSNIEKRFVKNYTDRGFRFEDNTTPLTLTKNFVG